jgi:hypothetical protein
VPSLALGEETLPRAPNPGTRRRIYLKSFNGVGGLGRQVTFFFPECCTRGRRPLPSAALYRVLGTLRHSGKPLFPECNSSPSATLREDWLPQVPDFWHSGKPATLGKFYLSRSVYSFNMQP